MEINKIGERIKEIREAKGITQKDLAKALCVKRETVNQWENGVRDLKTAYTIQIADYFGVSCDYILRGVAAENVETNRKIGLSNHSIEVLQKGYHFGNNENFQGLAHHADVINAILEIDSGETVLCSLYDYLTYKPPVFKNPKSFLNKTVVLVPNTFNTDEKGELTLAPIDSSLLLDVQKLPDIYLSKIQDSLRETKKELDAREYFKDKDE